jgi:hypothetical protein
VAARSGAVWARAVLYVCDQACVCGVRPGHVRRKAALAWPRREGDITALVRGNRAWQGRGGVEARCQQDDGGAGKVRGTLD